MVDRDVLIEKTNSIQNRLKRIHDTVGRDVDTIYTLDVQDIIVLNLQRAVQLTIDIAAYFVSCKNLGIPKALKDVFILLEQNSYINQELSSKLQKMVGFRNIAVHEYQAINLDILKAILKTHLKDIEDFYTAILSGLTIKD